MKIPYSLIKSYLDLDVSLPSICEALTLLGIEVDELENEKPPFSGVCVAEIVYVEPLPTSKRLSIAKIQDGETLRQVVCGASNCRVGLKTAYSKPGATLSNQTIQETSIQGVLSQGMLCSAQELGIPSEDDSGVLELPSEWINGQDLQPLLWDPVLSISLTPNLGHCMSALGIARELSLFFQKPLRIAAHSFKEDSSQNIKNDLHVELNSSKGCSRYLCRKIEGIKNRPSPFWLRQTLLNAGMRPINVVVDITNYLLLKTGQPLHAFDANKIEGNKIIICSAYDRHGGDQFIGIDEQIRTIPSEALLICDQTKPIALAGVMGSLDSSVSCDTQSVVIEAAAFDSLLVRKTARSLDLRTESAQRFEKGIDREALEQVLDEACSLISDLTEGTSLQGSIDLRGDQPLTKQILLRTKRVNQVLGTSLSFGEIEEFMQRLGCKIVKKDEPSASLLLTPPSFRNDLNEEIDLVEEAARIYGYNNIERKTPLCKISSLPHDPLFLFENELRKRLVASGLQEILTCDLISPKLSELSPELLYPKPALLSVCCAKSEEFSVLRPSLLAGNLEVVRTNLDQKNFSLAAFEIGTIYQKGPQQIPACSLVLTGMNRPHHWEQKPREWDFYDLKGLIESFLHALRIEAVRFSSSSHSTFHPGRQANLFHEDLLIGALGEIHPLVLEKLDLKQRVFFAEFNLDHLQTLARNHVRCKPLAQFPSTERDWTFSLPEEMRYQLLLTQIDSLNFPLLEKVELIDLYNRNLTLRFTYRDLIKTISFEEAEKTHAAIIAHISEKLL